MEICNIGISYLYRKNINCYIMRGLSYNDVLPNLLIIPMVSHWVLPDSIERLLYIDLGYFKFYVFNILFFFYLYNYKKLKIDYTSKYLKVCKVLNLLCFLFLLFSVINLAYCEGDLLLMLLVNNLSFVLFIWIYFNFPLDYCHIKSTKKLLCISLFILCLEVVIFSLGLVHYTSATGNEIEGESFEDIMRVSTTIGAATGTSLVLAVLGAICVSIEQSKVLKLCLYLLTTLAILLTVSRGGILTWFLFSLLYFYRNYYVDFSIKKRFLSLFFSFLVAFLLYDIGVFDPVLSRNDRADGDITNGRTERFEKGLITYYNSSYYGVGIGRVYPDKSVADSFYSPYFSAPHNYYIIVLAENGIIGMILVGLLLLVVLFVVDYKCLTSGMLVLLLLINFNTEGIWGYSEFASLFAFLAMCSISRNMVFNNR